MRLPNKFISHPTYLLVEKVAVQSQTVESIVWISVIQFLQNFQFTQARPVPEKSGKKRMQKLHFARLDRLAHQTYIISWFRMIFTATLAFPLA